MNSGTTPLKRARCTGRARGHADNAPANGGVSHVEAPAHRAAGERAAAVRLPKLGLRGAVLVLVAACLVGGRTCEATIAQNILGGLGSALASVRGGATTAETPGGPRILRRVNSHPLLRVKSFGELSSVEYDELIRYA